MHGLRAEAPADHHVAVDGPSASGWQFGDVTLVPDERLVLRQGRPVALTPKAFDLLLVLAQNSGRLLTKEQLMQAVWADTVVEEANLSYHVFAIRKALGDAAENGLITTVPKRGYRFTAAVTRSDGSEGQPLVPGDHPECEPVGSVSSGQANAGPVSAPRHSSAFAPAHSGALPAGGRRPGSGQASCSPSGVRCW